MLMKNLKVFSVVFAAMTLFSNASLAADLPTFKCILTDKLAADGAPESEVDTFTKTTSNIYYVCQSDNVVQSQQVKAVWIAVNTNNAAPANYKIDEKTLAVDANASSDKIWTATNSVSSPTAGWPLGQYKVELYVDDKLATSKLFSIK
jgi:hypothetical protein